VQLPVLLTDSLLAVVKLQQLQQQHDAPFSCWISVMNSINLHVSTCEVCSRPAAALITFSLSSPPPPSLPPSPTALPQIHGPVSAFLRSGRLHPSWLTPLSAATAAYLRLNVLGQVDAALPSSLWDVCKRCAQVPIARSAASDRHLFLFLNALVQARPTEALAEVSSAPNPPALRPPA
jgi:hypothetical protein